MVDVVAVRGHFAGWVLRRTLGFIRLLPYLWRQRWSVRARILVANGSERCPIEFSAV